MLISKVHNKQSIIVFLFFEVYNVNYKGELTSLYVGFSKKSNSHLSVFLSSSENCQFKLMALLYKAGKFKSKQLNIFWVWLFKKSQNILLFDNFWIYFDTNYNSVYLNLLRRKQQQKLNNTKQSRVINSWRVKNVKSLNIDTF